MTTNATIIENLRIMRKEQYEMYDRFAQLESHVNVLQEGLMDALVDFKSYQMKEAKNGRSKKVSGRKK